MAYVENPHTIRFQDEEAKKALGYQNELGTKAVQQAESGQSAAAQQMRMGLGAARQQAQAQAAAGGPLAQRAAAYSQGQNAQQAVTQAAQMQAQEAAVARQMQMQAAMAASQGQLGISQLGLDASVAQGQQQTAEQDLALKEMQSDRELGTNIAGAVLSAAGSAAALSDERMKRPAAYVSDERQKAAPKPTGGDYASAGLSAAGSSLMKKSDSGLGPGLPGGAAEQHAARELPSRQGPSGYQGASARPFIADGQGLGQPALGTRSFVLEQPAIGSASAMDEREAAMANEREIARLQATPPAYVSDERQKLPRPRPEEEDEMIRSLRGTVYEYRDEAREAYGAPPGPQYGPTAQSMERSDLGRLAVRQDGSGTKLVDSDQGLRVALGSIGRLGERLDALEGRGHGR